MLVDSEIIAGVVLNIEQTMAFGVGFGVGMSATAVAGAVKTEFGITLPANLFVNMGARIIATYPGKLRPMDGILELRTTLKPKRCIAPNSPIARVQQVLTTRPV